jgi:DNA polymerase III delta subunit
MIIYLYGPDSYRRLQKQKEVLLEYQKKHASAGVERFYLNEEGQWQKFKDSVRNKSLFSRRRLIFVYGLSDLKLGKDDQDFLRTLTKLEDVAVIFSEDSKPDEDLVFLLKEPALAQEFGLLTGSELHNFIANEIRTRGIKLEPVFVQSLADFYGGDVWGVVTELDKVSLVSTPLFPITGPRLVSGVPFFKLLYSLGSRNIKDRLRSLEILLASEDHAKIFNFLAYQKGVNKNAFAEYDVAVKSGRLDYSSALTDFVLG